jgi:hypothetical protein
MQRISTKDWKRVGTPWNQKKGLSLLAVVCPHRIGAEESKIIAIAALSFTVSLAV